MTKCKQGSRMRAALVAIATATATATAAIGVIPGVAEASEPGVSQIAERTWGTGPLSDPEAGRVYAIAVGNGRIYLGGSFTEAVSPTGEVMPRRSLIALNAATGELDTGFSPDVAGVVRALALSEDGTRLFVGGRYARIGGANHANLAAVDATTGAAVPDFRADTDDAVWALDTGSGRVYAGGLFTTVADASGTSSRQRLAALDLATGAVDRGWNASADAGVRSVEVSVDTNRVFVGGEFTALNGGAAHLGAVDAATGATDPAFTPPSTPLVYDIDADGDNIYLALGGGGGQGWALNAVTGHKLWGVRGNGDFQAVAALDGLVYLGGHFGGIDKKGNIAFDGVLRYKLAAVKASDGTLVEFAPHFNSPLGVYALATDGQDLHVGGDFTRILDSPPQELPHYARLRGPAPPAAPSG